MHILIPEVLFQAFVAMEVHLSSVVSWCGQSLQKRQHTIPTPNLQLNVKISSTHLKTKYLIMCAEFLAPHNDRNILNKSQKKLFHIQHIRIFRVILQNKMIPCLSSVPMSNTVRSPGNTITNVLSVYLLRGSLEPFSSATTVPISVN